MNSQPNERPEPRWLLSSWDFRIHAFPPDIDDGGDFLEAVCEHSVPPLKIIPAGETVLEPQYCPTCFRIYVDTFPSQDEHLHD